MKCNWGSVMNWTGRLISRCSVRGDMVNGPCPSLLGRHYISWCGGCSDKQVSHLDLIVCRPSTHGVTVAATRPSHGRDFISETVTVASPSALSVPFCYRYAVRHQRPTFMNDWLVITWHRARRWIINIVVICPAETLRVIAYLQQPCQPRPLTNYFQTEQYMIILYYSLSNEKNFMIFASLNSVNKNTWYRVHHTSDAPLQGAATWRI